MRSVPHITPSALAVTIALAGCFSVKSVVVDGGPATGGTTGGAMDAATRSGGAPGGGGTPGSGGDTGQGGGTPGSGGSTGTGGGAGTGGTGTGGTGIGGAGTGGRGTGGAGTGGSATGGAGTGGAGTGGAGTGGRIGTGGAGTGGAGTGGAGTGGAGTGGAGVTKRCSTWTTVLFADFNDGTRGGLTDCFGCSAAGCANVVGQQLYMPSQWNLVCYPGLSATETRAIRISYDVTDQGTMGGMGWDNFSVYLKTNLGGAGCGDSSPHNVTYAVPAPSLVGHWDLIRWGGNSFQFNHNGARLGEIDCALPALSGMAVDFHEGGPGLAQSRIDNFRVEVCELP